MANPVVYSLRGLAVVGVDAQPTVARTVQLQQTSPFTHLAEAKFTFSDTIDRGGVPLLPRGDTPSAKSPFIKVRSAVWPAG